MYRSVLGSCLMLWFSQGRPAKGMRFIAPEEAEDHHYIKECHYQVTGTHGYRKVRPVLKCKGILIPTLTNCVSGGP